MVGAPILNEAQLTDNEMIIAEYEVETVIPNRITLTKVEGHFTISVLLGETFTQTKIDTFEQAAERYREQKKNLDLIAEIDTEIFECRHVVRTLPMGYGDGSHKKLFSNRTLIANNTHNTHNTHNKRHNNDDNKRRGI